jgi:hypothetical protein
MKPTTKILVAFTAPAPEDPVPLGTIWQIEVAKSDFYLKAVGGRTIFHLSVHGPNSEHDGHRFHLKIDEDAASSRSQQGEFLAHRIPEDGQIIAGVQVAPAAYRVARIRWLWDLQRPRYMSAARRTGPLPSLSFDGRSGGKLSWPLEPNGAADIDLVVSYNKPFWPDAANSLRDNGRLGPLRNSAGMWLTATSYHRSQTVTPSPAGVVPGLPTAEETATRLLCCAPRPEPPSGDMYWFVDAITSTRVLQEWPREGDPTGPVYG